MSEISRRVRAARGYAGLKQSELGERLGQPGDRSVKRTEKGVRDPTLPEQRMIAEVCGLPHAFFLVDFERLPELLADPSHSQARVESVLLSREEGDETPSPTLRDAAEEADRRSSGSRGKRSGGESPSVARVSRQRRSA